MNEIYIAVGVFTPLAAIYLYSEMNPEKDLLPVLGAMAVGFLVFANSLISGVCGAIIFGALILALLRAFSRSQPKKVDQIPSKPQVKPLDGDDDELPF